MSLTVEQLTLWSTGLAELADALRNRTPPADGDAHIVDEVADEMKLAILGGMAGDITRGTVLGWAFRLSGAAQHVEKAWSMTSTANLLRTLSGRLRDEAPSLRATGSAWPAIGGAVPEAEVDPDAPTEPHMQRLKPRA